MLLRSTPRTRKYCQFLKQGEGGRGRGEEDQASQYERKPSTLNTFFEENPARTKLSLVNASTIYQAHANQLDFLKKTKK